VVPTDAVKLPANVPVEAENIPEELASADDETVNGPNIPEEIVPPDIPPTATVQFPNIPVKKVIEPEILAELEVKVPAGVT
jgi:hypothetical protein